MAWNNTPSVTFTEKELKDLDEALARINAILEGKAVNLTPEDHRKIRSVKDRSKVLVDKSKHYMETQLHTLPKTIDKDEFDRDYTARTHPEERLRELAIVQEKLSDTKTLLDFDNLRDVWTYYRYIKFLSKQNEPGITSIYQDLKQYYRGGRRPTDEALLTESSPPPTARVGRPAAGL